jgi:hypothetical protein
LTPGLKQPVLRCLISELEIALNGCAIHKAGLDNAATFSLTVPQFFDTSHGYVHGGSDGNGNPSIRPYLMGSGQRLMTSAEAASIGSFLQANNSRVLKQVLFIYIYL